MKNLFTKLHLVEKVFFWFGVVLILLSFPLEYYIQNYVKEMVKATAVISSVSPNSTRGHLFRSSLTIVYKDTAGKSYQYRGEYWEPLDPFDYILNRKHTVGDTRTIYYEKKNHSLAFMPYGDLDIAMLSLQYGVNVLILLVLFILIHRGRKNMTQGKWIKVLQEEGFSDVHVVSMPANASPGEHTHNQQGVHIILQGDVTLADKTGITIYKKGDRIDITSNTTHSALFGPHGCTMIVGTKE